MTWCAEEREEEKVKGNIDNLKKKWKRDEKVFHPTNWQVNCRLWKKRGFDCEILLFLWEFWCKNDFQNIFNFHPRLPSELPAILLFTKRFQYKFTLSKVFPLLYYNFTNSFFLAARRFSSPGVLKWKTLIKSQRNLQS